MPRQRADLSYWTVAVLVIALSYWGLHSQSRLQTVYAVEKESRPSEHQETQDNNNSPSTVDEARGRARLLHETIHGSLQIMHRDFFREDEGLPIPSHSLEDVFKELTRSHNVQIRWLAINARAMDVDHEPKSEFDKEAVRLLSSGKDFYELQSDNSYQYVGAIRLSASCLKCHLPARSSNADRTAGLVIKMPLKIRTP